MAKVSAAKVPRKTLSKRDLYATVCFYYPRYSLKEAQKLPARDVQLLINTAIRLESTHLYNLTQISMSPHTKDGKAVKQLLEHFKKKAGL